MNKAKNLLKNTAIILILPLLTITVLDENNFKSVDEFNSETFSFIVIPGLDCSKYDSRCKPKPGKDAKGKSKSIA